MSLDGSSGVSQQHVFTKDVYTLAVTSTAHNSALQIKGTYENAATAFHASFWSQGIEYKNIANNASVYGLYLQSPTKSTSATGVNSYGVYVDNNYSDVFAKNYGVFSNLGIGNGNNFNFYSSGNAPNFLQGNTNIGGLPSAPNITLSNNGRITAKSFNEIYISKGANNLTSNLAIGNSTTLVDPALSGTLNVGIGNNALNSVTTGQSNVAIGSGTLSLTTTGVNNIAFAYNALANNVDGSSNFAGGRGALKANVDGSFNIAIGTDALSSNVNGSRNLALGVQAGQVIEGSNNTILGSYTGTGNPTLNDTVVISAGTTEKLRIDDTGSLLFGGTLPLAPAITLANDGSAEFSGNVTLPGGGGDTDALQKQEIESLIAGSGGAAGDLETVTTEGNTTTTLQSSGNVLAKLINNLIFGQGNNSISTNIAIGTNGVLTSITTGSTNTAIGSNSMKLTEDGSKNTAVGNKALTANVSGSSNTAVGQLALTVSTASFNTAFGMSAGRWIVDGQSNTAVGHNALWTNVGGSYNTVIGQQAGYYFEGSNNTILGAYKGPASETVLNDTVIISAGITEKLRIDSTGSLLFGGTLPSAPAIELTTAGKITAAAYDLEALNPLP
jgi:hypothetical protein